MIIQCFRSRFVACAVLLGVVLPQSVAASSFSDDGTFDPLFWSKTIIGSGDVIDSREASGGNPDRFLRTRTVPSGGFIVHAAFLNSNATWDPSVEGAIASVDMKIDVKLFQSVPGFTDGQAFGIAVSQGGKIYRSGYPVTGLQFDSFDMREILGQDADNFAELLADGSSIPQRPDFSASGSAITFGFLVANSGNLPISGTTAGYDNWSLAVHPQVVDVPVPASIPLLISSLALIFGASKMRRFRLWAIATVSPKSLQRQMD